MGERKGTNKYYPPDYDPAMGGLNKFRGVHALRERGRKAHLGIIIIRFEMPYNIWCNGCQNHIGMGVRYNAEKTKLGMYYSTPIYQFRMKCHLCDNHFEIKTDPANLDYVIVSGARRQENRWDPLENSQVVPEEKETSRRLFDDPMYKLEHGVVDVQKSKEQAPHLNRLLECQDVWKDDFAINSKLRSKFREKKKEIKSKEIEDSKLCKKLGINVPLVSEHEDDKKLASLLLLRPSSSRVKRMNIKVLAKKAKNTAKNKAKNKEERAFNPLNIIKKEKLETKSPLQSLADYKSDSSDDSDSAHASKVVMS